MPTVILGGGIIGSSIAYYLSKDQPSEDIHIIESSEQLFNAASGYGAGFLAKDWFAPSLAPLGALSFKLHDTLAAEHGGAEKWGYMRGTAMTLSPKDTSKKNGPRGDDWLREGTSRAETSSGSSEEVPAADPVWLTKQKGMEPEKISNEGTVAQVDPLRLCKFLMDAAISQGVKLHHPAKATSLETKGQTITGVKVLDLKSQAESMIPCTNLIVCTGPWTPQVFRDLFPSSRALLPVAPLAGYSLVFKSPRYTIEHEKRAHKGRSHAFFTTYPESCGFSPEFFSREGAEIWIGGLNSSEMHLPERAGDTSKQFDPREMDRLKQVAVRLMGKLPEDSVEATDGTANTDDLEIVREGLCFRPVSGSGVPFVSKVEDQLLGGGLKMGSGGGVFVATGHGPWGISLSLGTGKVVAEMVEGVPTAADVSGLKVKSKL